MRSGRSVKEAEVGSVQVHRERGLKAGQGFDLGSTQARSAGSDGLNDQRDSV